MQSNSILSGLPFASRHHAIIAATAPATKSSGYSIESRSSAESPRYEQTASSSPGFLCLAAVKVWLPTYVNGA